MRVYLTNIEYHYFRLGALSVAHYSEPSIAKNDMSCIAILRDEIIQDLGEGRILIQKKV